MLKCLLYLLDIGLVSFRSKDCSSDFPKELTKTVDISTLAKVSLSDVVMIAGPTYSYASKFYLLQRICF